MQNGSSMKVGGMKRGKTIGTSGSLHFANPRLNLVANLAGIIIVDLY